MRRAIAAFAIPAWLLTSGVATSQSVVDSSQVNLGDVFADQTLNVVSTEGPTTATGSAMGNALLAGVDSGTLNVHAAQTASGAVQAKTSFAATTYAGGVTALGAYATGNSAEVDSLGGGALVAAVAQAYDGAGVTSEIDFSAAAAQVANVSAVSQAVANAATIGLSGASADATISQTESTTVDAESGSDASGGATLQYTAGEASFLSAAVGNSVTLSGNDGSGGAIGVSQNASGPLVQAAQFLNVGNGQTVEGAASASANAATLDTAGPGLTVTLDQTSDSYVFSDSVTSAYEFGTGGSSATSSGDLATIGNQGASTTVTGSQSNSAGVDAVASFSGATGYDAAASASAFGNSVTGYACSACGGAINANMLQTNSGGVAATSSVAISGSNRSVSSSATAVGNNAAFYNTKP